MLATKSEDPIVESDEFNLDILMQWLSLNLSSHLIEQYWISYLQKNMICVLNQREVDVEFVDVWEWFYEWYEGFMECYLYLTIVMFIWSSCSPLSAQRFSLVCAPRT